jgi:hypothetical protein
VRTFADGKTDTNCIKKNEWFLWTAPKSAEYCSQCVDRETKLPFNCRRKRAASLPLASKKEDIPAGKRQVCILGICTTLNTAGLKS